MSFNDWSPTPGDNTDVGGVNIGEGMSPSGVNNAIRTVMAELAGGYAEKTFFAGLATTARSLAERFAQHPDVKDFGAVGDGTENDKDALQAAITAEAGPVSISTGTYYMDDEATVSNVRLDVRGDGGTLLTDQQATMLRGNASTPQGREDAAFSQIIGVGFKQPYFGGTGTDNNHTVASFSGQSPLVALSYGAVDIAPSLGYGPNTAPRNAWGGVLLGNRHIVYTMGFQCFTGYVSVAGNTLIGDGTPTGGTRANAPGYRYAGYNTSGIDPNIGAVSAANVSKDIRNALSLQNTASYGNHVGFHGTNAEVGVHFTEVATNDDAVQRHNIISATFKDAERAVYFLGAEYNIIEVNASGSTEWAIDARPSGAGDYGTGRHNWIRGIIRDASGTRGVSVTVPDARLDLAVIDSSAGVTISGARATGRIKVDGVPGRGGIISSSGHHLDITTLNCGGDFDVVVFGDDGVFNLNCTGNVSVSGNNNTLIGRIGGSVSCTGTGNKFVGIIGGPITGRANNDFSGVKGERYRARVDVTTDASGDFTVTTNLPTITQNATATIISDLSGGVYGYCVPKSVAANTVTFRAFDTTGAAIVSDDLVVMVTAERHA